MVPHALDINQQITNNYPFPSELDINRHSTYLTPAIRLYYLLGYSHSTQLHQVICPSHDQLQRLGINISSKLL